MANTHGKASFCDRKIARTNQCVSQDVCTKLSPLFFMEAIRDGEREIRATGTGMLSQLLQDVEYDDVEDDVLAGLQEANSALSSSDQIRSLSTDLTQQLGNLVPGGQGELRIAVADEDMSQLSSNLRLQIRKRPEELHAALSRQGTGMQNLILISMFRHLMQKKQEETWKKTPILCIEEPESHLHPHAQRRLYRDLCQINVPTIITTHSPALVKYADPSSLIICDQTLLTRFQHISCPLHSNQKTESNCPN